MKTQSPKQNVLITGANGFLGRYVVKALADVDEFIVTALVRDRHRLNGIDRYPVEIAEGDLSDRAFVETLLQNKAIIVHLAASTVWTPMAMFANTVNTTENLFRIIEQHRLPIRRFVFVSSLAVYDLASTAFRSLIDEDSPLESQWPRRDPYSIAKFWQERAVREKCEQLNIPFVILRPGAIYGHGGNLLSNRVLLRIPGMPFGLQIGRRTIVPVTYVENCAEAIKLATLKNEVVNETFNIIDDDMPTQTLYLRLYEKYFGRAIRKIYIPYRLFRFSCLFFEYLTCRSKGNFPEIFSRYRVDAIWKPHRYTNRKLKSVLGWQPDYTLEEAFTRIQKLQQNAAA